jgi:WD40 repeat protein/serine/threonine protein kinase/tetratricopeptide (TPR) repeat protein
MTQGFQRDYLLRLPLPLAQLYSRAHNAKDARARHDTTFYLFEALIKLTAAPAIAAYLHKIQYGGTRIPSIDRQLVQVALPSFGQWLGMLRELARFFGTRPDAASHPLGHLWQQLETKRRDLPALTALYRRIKNGPDGEPSGDQSCSLLQLFDALVQYRNSVFGHGAARFEAFYQQEMGPLLFPAANAVLAEGVLDFVGPPGSRLVYLTELRTVEADRVEAGLRELVGLQGERLASLALTSEQAAGLLPNRVAVLWSGRPVPLRLDPLLVYREGELAEEVLFLNRDRNGRQVEYLSYATGRTERNQSTVADLAALLSQVTNRQVTEAELDQLAEQSRVETPSVEALFGPSETEGQRLGEYEILAEIGRGGMGVVYLARQTSLGRLVALKMLPADLAGDEVVLARFRREIRTLSRCDHPNIVKVLASGTLPDGQLYYTMEHIAGCDLELVWRELAGPERSDTALRLGNSTWARAVHSAVRKRREQTVNRNTRTEAGAPAPNPPSLPLPPLPELPNVADDPGGYVRRVVQMVRDAALALQAVHDQGIIHRDVSPSNLMLTPDGSRVVLMDFGLAKGQTETTSVTRAGGFLGKWRYAAPEQLAAATLPVGPAADVRGLGVTLWELLTRRRLFEDARDEKQLATKVHEEDVPRIRTIDPTLDRDLEAIVARATERRIVDRIASAGRLADYLQLYLDGKPLPIRPPGMGEMLGRWVRAHRGLVATMAGAAVVVLVAVVTAFVLVNQAREKAVDEAKRNEQLALEKTRLADENERVAEDEKKARAEMLLQRNVAVEARKGETTQRLAAEEAARVARVHEFASRALPYLDGSRDPQYALGWALAAVRAHQPPLDDALTVLYGAVQANQLLALLPRHNLPPSSQAFDSEFYVQSAHSGWSWSPDSQTFVAADHDGDVQIWTRDGKVVANLALSPRGEPFSELHRRSGRGVSDFYWSPDATRLRFRDDDTLYPLQPQLFQDSPLLLVDGPGNAVRLYDGTGRLQATLVQKSAWPRMVAWSPSGHAFLTTHAGDQEVRIWDRKGRSRTTLVLQQPVGSASWSGALVLTVSGTSSGNHFPTVVSPSGVVPLLDHVALTVWGEDGKRRATVQESATRIRQAGWVPGQQLLWTGNEQGQVRIWDATGKLRAAFGGRDGLPAAKPSPKPAANEDHRNEGLDLRAQYHWNPRGTALVIRIGTRAWRLWDVGGKPLTSWEQEHGACRTILWSPNGRYFVPLAGAEYFTPATDGERTVRLWSAQGKRVVELGGRKPAAQQTHDAEHHSPVRGVVWSPDSRFLVTLTQDLAWVWQTDGKPVTSLGGSQKPVQNVLWSPSATMLAVVILDDPSIQIVSPRGESLGQIRGTGFGGLVWSPDSSRVAASPGYLTVGLYEPVRRPRVALRAFAAPVGFVSWQPSGNVLLTGAMDKPDAEHGPSQQEAAASTLALWDLARDQQVVPDVFAEPLEGVQWHPTGQLVAVLARNRLPPKTFSAAKARGQIPQSNTLSVITPTGQTQMTLEGVEWFGWNPKGKTLACALSGDRLRLINPDGKTVAEARHDAGTVRDLLWSPGGQVFATQHLAPGQENGANNLAWNEEKKVSTNVLLWNADGQRVTSLLQKPEPVEGLVWSPAGDLLALSIGRTVQLWDRQGQRLATFTCDQSATQLAWNADGRMLATADDSQERGRSGRLAEPRAVELWARDGHRLARCEGHRGRVRALAWNPHQPMLATAGDDHTIRYWRPDGAALYRLEGHEGPVELLTWNPAGTLLASAAAGQAVRLWDGIGRPIATLSGPTWALHPFARRTVLIEFPGDILKTLRANPHVLAWNKDGTRLAAALGQDTVLVWPTDFPALYQTALAKLLLPDAWISEETAQSAWNPESTGAWLAPGTAAALPAADPLRAAAEYAAQGRWAQALEAYTTAIRRQPRNPELYRLRGEVYAEVDLLDRAFTDFEKATQLEPENTAAWVRLGDLYQRAGWSDQALDAYERSLRLDPADHHHQKAKLGRLYARKADFIRYGGDDKLRLDFLSKALELDQANREEYAAEIAEIEKARKQQTARQAVQRGMERSRQLRNQGKFKEAVTELTSVIALQPENAAAYELRALSLWELKPPDRRILTDFARAVTLQPGNDLYHYLLGYTYLYGPVTQQRNAAKAIVHADTACTLTAWKVARYMHLLAEAQRSSGRQKEAIQTYERARTAGEQLVASQPKVTSHQVELANTCHMLGWIQNNNGQPVAAMKAYEQACVLREKLLAASPQDTNLQRDLAQTYNNLGLLHETTGALPAALKAHEQARALREKLKASNPKVVAYQVDLAWTYNNLGWTQHRAGQREPAEKSYGQALALWQPLTDSYPADAVYRAGLAMTAHNLSRLQRDSGRLQEAVTGMGKAVAGREALRRQYPNDAGLRRDLMDTYRDRADALTRLGRHTEALADWDKAVPLAQGPEVPRLRLQRALSRVQGGDHLRAMADVDDLAQAKALSASFLYDLARISRLAVAAVQHDTKLPAMDRNKRGGQYAVRALDLLRQATHAFWKTYWRKRAVSSTNSRLPAAAHGPLVGTAGHKAPEALACWTALGVGT